ncbi:conserved hypothetical protein [Anaeromyxobacter dehalogenans 2CP-1]|uniref:Uncharacterized protein n=1 Tax=Anaeromyxobacter dehalogenans (strain ATCC BAA-258 / DSM 21875 / 2CP-1) TaxID=455488 RepID=B8JDZ8_ANAD2|nr:hypothetical protein [Anaeromyxobacter dehalogenans]ACL66063.1 conserved hypothetical protein [Anaeromyxobacter dehalogenans 2CP-1]
MIPSVRTGAALLSQGAALAADLAQVAAPRTIRAASAAGVGKGGAVIAAAAAALPSAKKTSAKKTRRSSGAGYASGAKGTTKSGAAKKPSSSRSTGALAFLDDPRLSIEEKLFRFMMYVQDRFDRDVEQKMKEAAGKASGTSGSSGAKKKKGGPFAKLAGALKTAFPALGMSMEILNDKNVQALVKTLGGPALAAGAAAMGFPGLAPVLAKAGPQLAGVAFDLAAAFKDAPASGSSGTGGTGGTGSTGSADSPEIDRKKMMELQYAMEKQKEMFTLVSNVLRSLHDMKMSAVHNIRS